MWSKKKCHVIVNCFRYRLPCNGANCNLRQVFHPYGVYPDDENIEDASRREPRSILGDSPSYPSYFVQGKDTDNFSNNRLDASINCSLEVKIILDGS